LKEKEMQSGVTLGIFSFSINFDTNNNLQSVEFGLFRSTEFGFYDLNSITRLCR